MSLIVNHATLASCDTFYFNSWLNISTINESSQEVNLRNSVIDYSIPNNRLRSGENGFIETLPKSLGEVVGELLFKPIIDQTCSLSSWVFLLFRTTFSTCGFRNFENVNDFIECGEILSLPTFKVREIAKSLGTPNPNDFTVYADPSKESNSAMLVMMKGTQIIIVTKQLEQALRGDPSAKYTSEEVEGVLAHEIAHGVLGHSNPDHPLWSEFLRFRDNEFDLGDPILVSKLEALYFGSHRAMEREADLFTVKEPRLAKGLINRLKRARIGQPPETSSPNDSHPSDAERIAYLTHAVCKQTKGNDLDLCKECFSDQSINSQLIPFHARGQA